MKSMKLALIAAGIVLSASAYSQENTTKKDSSVAEMPSTEQPATTPITPAEPLVKPNFGVHCIAVLGSYTSSPETANTEKSITITGDEENPGKIWIEGLTDVKIYALRKPVPGNYKIPAQKADDKSIAEGTVIFDEITQEINICLGCNYKDENPGEAFAITSANEKSTAKTAKKKVNSSKIISFTGNKTETGTASK